MNQQCTRLGLASLLVAIQANDTKYAVRYGLVLQAVAYAHRLGYMAGFRLHPDEPEWPVAFIQLPTGQVSWHLPQHPMPWDGHDTVAKYERIRRFTLEAEANDAKTEEKYRRIDEFVRRSDGAIPQEASDH